ncbi:MAG: hypothetical protein A3C44_03330 [Gammaproteobacteria bacterium RIFCSPHIGHO2_02_FULL_39_13]|nr:MAG: hypothetical protein A3C44_03330 [Gammaproteobacteria bacterium RIFCSPHIGHO2_02_FULL_39_13]OGT48562.1 MAG: hypothetical protein A3E53_04220 [Gammaproteobacteria bacterium RIFCSPHIGHO2_12_FULL_39_24]
MKMELNISAEEWHRYFLLVEKSYITQAWAYGDARKIFGWKTIRGIFVDNGVPIALLQIMYKKFLFMKIVRISYGPLWLIKCPTDTQIREIFYIIKKRWNVIKGCLLFIAPNLENTPENNEILYNLSYFKRKCINAESGLIDLRLSADELRAGIRSNWRNHLKLSEKNALSFHISQTDDDFQWLMSFFKNYQKEKKFRGYHVAQLKEIFSCFSRLNNAWVTIVSKNQGRLGGSLIIGYGTCCVALIIWMSENGRCLNAGNFLLWNSILHAKNQGYLKFDLGSTRQNSFKKGLPQMSYELVGEYFILI